MRCQMVGKLGGRAKRLEVRQPQQRKTRVNAVSVPGQGPKDGAKVLQFDTPAGTLMVGHDGHLSRECPGNGGLRLWSYKNDEAARKECEALSRGMTGKHDVYNTGFSGAKLVLNSSDPAAVDKEEVMQYVADALNDLDGKVYTGCDLNTSEQDMEYLTSLSPYVLASIDCAADSNVATGEGVFGAVMGAIEFFPGGVRGNTFMVKGCGKVGSVVARSLVNAGAKAVYTFDVVSAAADIPGCVNVSDKDWTAVECDVFVPCSVSGFITVDAADKLAANGVKLVCGASNVPFADEAALERLLERGIEFLPEAVSSAGAVLCDSIEMYDSVSYQKARPIEVYAYIRHLTKSKARELMLKSQELQKPACMCLAAVKNDDPVPVGTLFSDWMKENTVEYDVAVVGAGMAGTACAYYLTRDDPSVTVGVIDSRTVAHAGGSSYGASRMYRQMYSVDYFSKLQTDALKLWGEIQSEHGVKLLSENGLIFYGETDTGETVEGSVPGAAEVMQRLGIPHTYYDDAAALNAKWPMKAAEGMEGVYEATAGSANASLTCETLMSAAAATGRAELNQNEVIEDIHEEAPGSILLTTSRNRFIRCKKLVLSPGAWVNDLLAHVGVQLDVEVQSVHWGHYRVRPELRDQMPQWFCFLKEKPGTWDGGLYYGFPAETEEPVIKVGIDFTPEDPRFRTRTMAEFNYEPDARVTKLIDDFLEKYWPGVFEERLEMKCSPYAMTKDGSFVLDKVPGHDDIVVFTGGSGRAFKFAPLLGRCMADLVQGKEPTYDIGPFSIHRPEIGLQMATKQQQGGAPAPAAA
ncbi:unnamed protein product [Pedinophyceae sp. YPF-701]|nr:unnamed protein product [Pedinophyceae sp. YPF-701]